MPTAPTFTTSQLSSFTTTDGVKTLSSMGLAAGSLITVVTISSDPATVVAAGFNPLLTFSLVDEFAPAAGYPNVQVWQAPVLSSTSYAVEFVGTGAGFKWGFGAVAWSAHSGVGVFGKDRQGSGSGQVTVATEWSNSAILYVQGDENAIAVTSRAWRTVSASITELFAFRQSGDYSGYGGYYSDAGAAGSKTPGLTAPVGQSWAAIAVEVKGVPALITGAAALAAAAVVAVVGALVQTGAVALAADSAMATAGTHIVRPWDRGWTGEVLFQTPEIRFRWSQRIVDFIESTRETEQHPDPSNYFGTGMTLCDVTDQDAVTWPAIRWSYRLADPLISEALQLGQMACDDPLTVEGGQGEYQIIDRDGY
jgi:hypothetical protein